MVRTFDKNTPRIILRTILRYFALFSMFTCPQLKLCNYFLDERLKTLKIKLKSNLQVAAINRKCKYYTIDNVVNDLKVKWIRIRIKRTLCVALLLI